jgi:glycosyltransferase involved in cell wall biosynthesis
MSVYNGERYVARAVDSILGQTFCDFEFVIIDDGSSDGTADILQRYTDSRIVRHTNPQNVGLTKSLNLGLTLTRGTYLARMDADDISRPERLACQVEFMRVHPEVGLLGTQFSTMGADGCATQNEITLPCEDVHIRWQILAENVFAHGSVMLRRSLLSEYGLAYDEECQVAQDYGLWLRLLCYTRGANLPARLFCYRAGGVSDQRRAQQVVIRDRLSAWAIRQYLPGATDEEAKALAGVIGGRRPFASDGQNVPWLIGRWLCLLQSFRSRHQLDPGMDALFASMLLRAKEALGPEPASVHKAVIAMKLGRLDPRLASFARESVLEVFGYVKVRTAMRRSLRWRHG